MYPPELFRKKYNGLPYYTGQTINIVMHKQPQKGTIVIVQTYTRSGIA